MKWGQDFKPATARIVSNQNLDILLGIRATVGSLYRKRRLPLGVCAGNGNVHHDGHMIVRDCYKPSLTAISRLLKSNDELTPLM